MGRGRALRALCRALKPPCRRRIPAMVIDPESSVWLDVGCGTGALTQTILDRTSPARVRSVDPSDAFVGYAAAHIVDPRVEFAIGDARSLPIVDAACDAVVSGLV